MTITYHNDLIQGDDAWLATRCGLLTASEMHLILTPTLKQASNDKERTHLYELMAQRITDYVDPRYINDDMLRGHEEEILARELYAEKYAPVKEVGFITNDEWGFKIGYSPDGLVGDDGLIECKSRRMKYQVETIATNEVPKEYLIQIQTGLLVTGRKWCDFISYCGGLPMFIKRVDVDEEYQSAIRDAAAMFEARLKVAINKYKSVAAGLHPTERRDSGDIVL